MVLLHITDVKNDLTSGVDVAVSQLIRAQSALVQTAVLNVNNTKLETAEHQFPYSADFRPEKLEPPFSRPDLAVFHGLYCFAYVRIARRLRAGGIPYVIIPHGGLASSAQKKKRLKKTAANLLFFNAFFRGAAAIQFLSLRERDDSRYREKGFLGTNGVRMPDWQPVCRPQDSIRMVYIGRTEVRIKGLDLMVEAVARCRDLFREQHIHLDLYGPDCGGGHAELRALLEKHGVSDCITLHGAVTGEEKENVLRSCDLFLQTSRTEGMPMGLLETLSYGIPCIVTKGTSLGEIIREYQAGWTAENSAQSIAEMIRLAVEERPLWPHKSRQARQLIADNYVWDKVVRDTLREYTKITERL